MRIPHALLIAICVLSGPSRASDVFEHALRATVRIAGGEASGTGFLVETAAGDAPQHVLVTAAHVFTDMEGATCQVVFRKQLEDGTFTRVEMDLALHEDDQPEWVRHPEADVALIPIVIPDHVDVQPFPASQIAAATVAADEAIRVGQEICIPCFPAKLESNTAGWPVLRRGFIASHPLTPLSSAATFLVDVSSFGGESGAPVVAWNEGRALVVGLITSMQRQTDQMTMPFEQRTVHTPLGLGIAAQSPFVLQLLTD